MTEVWVICDVQTETCGHGSTAKIAKIKTVSAYGGAFLPAFPTKEKADAYISALPFPDGSVAIRLDVLDATS